MQFSFKAKITHLKTFETNIKKLKMEILSDEMSLIMLLGNLAINILLNV